MSLSDVNVIQENTGTTAAGTSHAVTLPSGTTAGNTVVVAIFAASAPSSTGFVQAKQQGASVYVFYLPEVAAAATSWTFTTVGSVSTAWYVAEVSGLDPADPVDATQGATGTAVNGGTNSTGTTALNSGLSTVALAAFGINTATGANTVSWSGWTNGFDEVADVDSSTGPTLAVARLFESSTTRTFETTATLATNDGSSPNVYGVMVVFRAADSPIVAPLAMFAGFEQGTNGGTGVNGAASPFSSSLVSTGTWNTNWLIQAGSARNSSYGLRVVQSAGAAYVKCGTLTGKGGAFGFNVRVVSATGTVVVAEITNSGLGAAGQLLYDSSATKFGVRCGSTGTTSWQSGTTALNTFVWVDLRVKVNTSTWHADWRIETGTSTYTDQTGADLAGQSTTTNFSWVNLGGNASQTMTADYDDVVMSTYYSAYPLGPHEVKLLTVDPAGTPTISGTTANFGVFTANTTVGAWNAVNARNAVDEVPPTISAAADGATQTAVAASDYMEFPMATYTASATEFVNGVRMLAPMWSATAAAADLAIRGWDGTVETALATVAAVAIGAPTAVSATAPVWRCAMWQSTNGWTQAELDAAALRVGFSTDATPDIGVEALYLEVAVGRTRTQSLFGDFATTQVDPTRLGVVSIDATAPESGDASLYYEEAGTPTTVPVTAAATITEQINAALEPDTNYIAWYPPPEGVPDA